MAVLDATKLKVYNKALYIVGSRRLVTLTDTREGRRVLDEIWGTDDDLVLWALEKGEWNFALRAAEVDYTPSVSPGWGFTYAFDKPSDFRRLAGLYSDERMHNPLTNDQYLDEATYWFTDTSVIYVRYVSDHDDYGLNSAAWSEQFMDLLAARLAERASFRINNSQTDKRMAEKELERALKAAKSLDAMGEGVKFPPRGSWVRSRSGSRWNGETL